jgi:hypothetical protein
MGTGDTATAVCHAQGKGLLKPYVSKATGVSRAQATRLIAQYVAGGGGGVA